MIYHTTNGPERAVAESSIELIVEPRLTNADDLKVRRLLPSGKRRMVGPFVFFDHFGPAEFPPGRGISVRPHPHIGLATVTYLFEGEVLHRDSLGFMQPIRPGAVNLMTAGRGIVHSERAGEDLDELSRLHGIQSWMALPEDRQEDEPAFVHYPAAELPEFDRDGVKVRVIIGEAFGAESPVAIQSSMLYLECRMPAGSSLALPDGYDECAVYVVEGELQVDDKSILSGLMAVARPGKTMRLDASLDSRVMVIGGANLGPRRVWWNFVSTSKERIEQARDDWRAGRFGIVPGDEDEFIPLPD